MGIPSTTRALPHEPLGPHHPKCADSICNTLTVSGRRIQLAPCRHPLALCGHDLVRSRPPWLWAGVGISDPGKHDASILSQIPCNTRQSKYLCNTPFATLVCAAAAAPQRGSDKTSNPELGIGALSCVRLLTQRMLEVVHHFIYILRHRAGLVGVFAWLGRHADCLPSFVRVGSRSWAAICMQHCRADTGSAWRRRRMGWLA